MKTPIFVITHERVECLKAALNSYRNNIHEDFEIIIHDNNSKSPLALDFLRSLEKGGIQVNYSKGYGPADVWESVDKYLEKYNPEYYVVTDPDIELDKNGGDILAFYRYLLSVFPDIDVVGPMLRIDDIPDHYPLKASVIWRNYKNFYWRIPRTIEFGGRLFQYQRYPIDTTFGMYRANRKFKRPTWNGIRTYPPYSARHLDWYLDMDNLTEDQLYYFGNANVHGHWGSGLLKGPRRFKKMGLEKLNFLWNVKTALFNFRDDKTFVKRS